MRHNAAFGVLLLFLTASVQSQDKYADRVDSVRVFFENLVTNQNYCSAHAMIESPTQHEAGLAMLDTLLAQIGYNAINRFRLTALYLHSKDQLEPRHLEQVRTLWANEPIIPPHEEYERLIYFTSIKLMTEQLPNLDVWFNGKSAEENNLDATSFIANWMTETTREGQQIYDSPTYAPAMIVSMLLLQEFSRDSTIANRAKAIASWLLADFAVDYLEGQYTGSHGKESNESAMFPIISDMSQFGYLYFGDGYQLYGLEQYFASRADFEVAPEIVQLARDRKKAYESFELKRSSTRIRGDVKATYPIQKYTYMTPLYAVGSVPGGLNSAGEQHTWDVTWVSRQRNTTLFSMHPFASPESIAEFRPHPATTAYKFYTSLDNYYATASKSVGGSPYESVLQHKNTVIALYDVPDDLPRFPFITAYLPLLPNTFDVDSNKTQWITMDVGDVYIALFPLKPYNIFAETNSQRMYSRGGRNGVIVQVAGKNEIGAYKTFRSKIRKSRIDTTKFDSEGILTYTSIFGDTLTATVNERGTVNGKPPAFPDGMLFSSRNVTSKLGSGIMTITGRNTKLILDANTGAIRREVLTK